MRADVEGAGVRALRTLLGIYSVGLSISWAVFWVRGSYFREDPFAALVSLSGVDGQVGATLGLHVFGDLLLPYNWALQANPWGGFPVLNSYPPLANLLMEPATALSYDVVIRMALLGMVACMCGPIWWALRAFPVSLRFAGAGLALTTGPATAALDRGNTAGFVALPLFVLALAWIRTRQNVIAVCLAILVGLKLYPALISFQILATRRVRGVILGGLLTIVTSVLIWLWYPEPGLGEFRQFRQALGFFGESGGHLELVGNHSFAALLAVAGPHLGVASPWSHISPWAPGLVLIALQCALLLVRPQLSAAAITTAMALAFLATPVSFRYSQVFALVGVALVALAASSYRGLPVVAEGVFVETRRWAFLLALVLTLVPLIVTLWGVLASQVLVPAAWGAVVAVEAVSVAVGLVRRSGSGRADPVLSTGTDLA